MEPLDITLDWESVGVQKIDQSNTYVVKNLSYINRPDLIKNSLVIAKTDERFTRPTVSESFIRQWTKEFGLIDVLTLHASTDQHNERLGTRLEYDVLLARFYKLSDAVHFKLAYADRLVLIKRFSLGMEYDIFLVEK